MRTHVLATMVAMSVVASFDRSARADDLDDVDREMAKLLSATPAHGGATGTLAGYPATWAHEQTSSRNAHTYWVALRLKLPSDPGIPLLVRKTVDDDAAAKRAGTAIDVEVGNAAFDAAYMVEGAPSDLVRATLDPPAQKAIIALDEGTLSIDDRFLEVTVSTLKTVDEADRFVAVANVIGSHLHEGVTPAPGDALSAEDRAKELAKLRSMRAGRQPGPFFFVMMGLVGIAVITALVFNIRSRRRVARVYMRPPGM